MESLIHTENYVYSKKLVLLSHCFGYVAKLCFNFLFYHVTSAVFT